MSAFIGVIVGFFASLLSIFGIGQPAPTSPQLPPDIVLNPAQQTITQAKNTLQAAATSSSVTDPSLLYASVYSGVAPLKVNFGVDPGYRGSFGDFPCATIHLEINFGDGAKWDGDSCSFLSVDHIYPTPGTYHATFTDTTGSRPTTLLGSVPIVVRDVSNTPQAISVSGMSKYTDADFGFSFWYPSGWTVAEEPSVPGDAPGYGASASKTLLINSPSSANSISLSVSIDELTSPSRSVAVPGGTCGYCAPVTYYFDVGTHTWMQQYPDGVGGAPDMPQAQFEQTKIPTPTDVSTNTMGGLHIFDGRQKEDVVVIPLSAQHFLVISGTVPNADQYDYQKRYLLLANTIVATDPSVANPVSAGEQKTTIQAEKDAYEGQ